MSALHSHPVADPEDSLVGGRNRFRMILVKPSALH